jgi:branched-chain amino acid transport system substrate-binding protein
MGILRAVLFLLFLVEAFALRSAMASPIDSNPLKVGFLLPLSGDLAFLGAGIRDGALLAQEDMRARGIHVELVFEDNRGELAPSAAIAARLVAEGRSDALVSIISGVGRILKPIAAAASVVHIGICSDTEVADGVNSFINYLTAEQGAAKFVEYFSYVRPQGSLAIFSHSEAGFERIHQEVARQSLGKFKLSRVERYNSGWTDFRAQLLRLKASRPDAILLLGLSPEIELIAKQARVLQLQMPLTSIEGFGLAADKSLFEGQWFIDSATPNDEFQGRFRARFGREVTPGVGHSYDSVMLLAEAARERTDRRLSLAQALREISDYNGVIGKLSIKRNGVVWSDASVRTIKQGKVVKLGS